MFEAHARIVFRERSAVSNFNLVLDRGLVHRAEGQSIGEIPVEVYSKRTEKTAAAIHFARLREFRAGKKRQFAPFPVAINILEADFAEPEQLRFHVEQLVRGIFIRRPDGFEKLRVDLRRHGGNMFQIAEHAARREDFEYLLIQRALALMNQVMNREARDDGIEAAIGGSGTSKS
jgi:hypothetical protein